MLRHGNPFPATPVDRARLPGGGLFPAAHRLLRPSGIVALRDLGPPLETSLGGGHAAGQEPGSADQFVAGLVYGCAERRPVRRLVGGDPDGAGLQVHLNASHSGQLADLTLHGAHAVPAGHARDGNDSLSHSSVLTTTAPRWPGNRQACLTALVLAMPVPRPAAQVAIYDYGLMGRCLSHCCPGPPGAGP